MAETASVFGEMLVFERLRRQEQSPRARLALLCGFIEDAFGTVFRQIALTRFEQRLHAARRARGRAVERAHRRASGSRSTRRCTATRSPSPTTTAGGGPTSRTSSTRRSIATPTASASCWCWRSTSSTRSRAPRSCRSTSSCWPPAAASRRRRCSRRLGIDITQPEFWQRGLSVIRRLVDEAKALAEAA